MHWIDDISGFQRWEDQKSERRRDRRQLSLEHNSIKVPGKQEEPSKETVAGRIMSPQKFLYRNFKNLWIYFVTIQGGIKAANWLTLKQGDANELAENS